MTGCGSGDRQSTFLYEASAAEDGVHSFTSRAESLKQSSSWLRAVLRIVPPQRRLSYFGLERLRHAYYRLDLRRVVRHEAGVMMLYSTGA